MAHTIENIITQFPTVYNKVHESIYQSYQLLELVREMLERGDSNETILMVIDYVRESGSLDMEADNG